MRARVLLFILAVLGCCALPALADEPAPTSQDDLRAAVTKSLALFEQSRTEYLAQRDCFSCHHQLAPALALVTARQRGFTLSEEGLKEQTKLTEKHLSTRRESYQQGVGSGGQADTAGSALWTLELADWKPDETTAAVVEYLLQRNADQDHWNASSKRPPSEASHFTTTYLALRGLKTFATSEQKKRVDARIVAARMWLVKTTPEDTEDRVFRLRALKLVDAESSEIEAAAKSLLETQQDDGGWAQTEKMESDSYATGSALVALHEAGGLAVEHEAYQRGVAFLLRTQREDGSWHVKSRSKPFQKYFESGFPHGPDQFISIAASGWAATALVLAIEPQGEKPDSVN